MLLLINIECINKGDTMDNVHVENPKILIWALTELDV